MDYFKLVSSKLLLSAAHAETPEKVWLVWTHSKFQWAEKHCSVICFHRGDISIGFYFLWPRTEHAFKVQLHADDFTKWQNFEFFLLWIFNRVSAFTLQHRHRIRKENKKRLEIISWDFFCILKWHLCPQEGSVQKMAFSWKISWRFFSLSILHITSSNEWPECVWEWDAQCSAREKWDTKTNNNKI